MDTQTGRHVWLSGGRREWTTNSSVLNTLLKFTSEPSQSVTCVLQKMTWVTKRDWGKPTSSSWNTSCDPSSCERGINLSAVSFPNTYQNAKAKVNISKGNCQPGLNLFQELFIRSISRAVSAVTSLKYHFPQISSCSLDCSVPHIAISSVQGLLSTSSKLSRIRPSESYKCISSFIFSSSFSFAP